MTGREEEDEARVTTSSPLDREDQAIGQLRRRLRVVYRDRSNADVQGAVDRAVRRFTVARIRDFVPLLVERISRDELSNRPVRGQLRPHPAGPSS